MKSSLKSELYFFLGDVALFASFLHYLLTMAHVKANRRVTASMFPSMSLGTLSKDVFEQRTSTGSEAFSLFICLDANKLLLLSFFSLLKTIYPRVSTKPLPNDAKSPLPVDVRRSKTLLLKLPIVTTSTVLCSHHSV